MMKLKFLIGLLGSMVCISCLPNERIAGGTDPETGTASGRLVLADGIGAGGAEVTLINAEGSTRLETSTDRDGGYRFDSLKLGTYNLAALFVSADKESLMVSRQGIVLTAENPQANLGVSMLVPPGAVSARVLYRRNPVSSAICFIPGTSFLALTGGDGRCVISDIPPGKYAVAFSAPGYGTATRSPVNVKTQAVTAVGDVDLTVDPEQVPPKPTGLKAVYDATTGIVRLSWSRVTVSDLSGYVVYRDDTGATSFNPLHGGLVTDTAYEDTLFPFFGDDTPLYFAYRVRAQDRSGDQSQFARFDDVKATRPDLPSNPSPADGEFDVDVSPTLSWEPVKSPGATYTVYLGTDYPPTTPLAKGITASSVQAPGLTEFTYYYWRVVATVGGKTRPAVIWQFATGEAPPGPNPPLVSVASSPSNLRPTWTWVGGGGGNGNFRYKLDDGDLGSGATGTTARSFTPAADLAPGQHTLYVQESNAAGRWSVSGSATAIVGGGASVGLDVLANYNRPGTSSAAATGLWGYTGSDGREYALYNIRSPGALAVLEIFDGQQPVVPPKERGYIPAGHNSIWHEVRTCGKYAYKISQEGSIGLQVIDLAPLDAGGNAVLVKNITTFFSVAHTLHCDESVTPNRLYVVYGGTAGVKIFSLEDPLNPTLLSTLPGETHAVFARGNRMYAFTQRRSTVELWDVADPAVPVRRGAVSLGGTTISHSGWTSDDGRYLFTAEEVVGKPMKIFDVSDIAAPIKVGEFRAPATGTIILHNVYAKGKYLYAAHYGAGMRVWDISTPSVPVEVAFHQPNASPNTFGGTQDVYPFFKSGLAIHGDDVLGLFVLKVNTPGSAGSGLTRTGPSARK